ncbi:MAG: cobalt ECF transporter T component CbiQ [Cyanobacteria bacterium]|nr:cobalt ECF transporter T component CbiQ [Cyanobacteria bacterium CG_2015-16_32_12]NCO77633.1 cobalt ECF transporter T component CbiQ [Cyanobacteria bacterium CG_2015-22_32_23]NCQ04526.1 cobalt ECF transporter T component CbiQ [Cyanobacteria bacterium CG_2015-09_32_10]NCQ41079.1 cobalt ECF transporter T component CbiQ [Cyanobacteria bacterium CG_2015-04_32_10]NCS83479.1 cobalt ECF transporter T component CbiQ [Cyanobacteria bacterium CG_2015-02_32_10]
MHHQIDSLAYSNKLRWLPPEHKLIFALSLFILGYLSTFYIQILISVWLIIWIVIYSGIPFVIYRQLLGIPFSFWLMSLPPLIISISFSSNINNFQEDVIFGFPLGNFFFYFSHQGIMQGLMIFSRSWCLTSCMYFILLTIPFSEIIRILQKYKCPSLLTDLLLLMYRFIFILTTTISELISAQKSRFGYINWRRGMYSLSLAIAQLLTKSLENYRQISLGLTSRGFNGELRTWHSRGYKTNWRYLTEAIAGYSFLLMIIFVTK